MRTRAAARWLLAVLTVALAATACSDVVDGAGSGGPSDGLTGGSSASPSGSSSTGPTPTRTGAFPSTSTSATASTAPAQNFTCPGIVYPAAKLSFTCFSPNMTVDLKNTVWPLVELTPVDSSGWSAETGAGHWGAKDNDTLGDIAASVRDRMVSKGLYGTNAKVVTNVIHDTKLDGHQAHALACTITLDPAYAAKVKTKVKVEKLWIVSIEVAYGDVSLWYVSLPDLVSNRWAYVLQYINSIKVLG